MKILIVEDERIIRDQLVKFLSREELGISSVMEAINGEEGFSLFIKYHPQLVLCDIKMQKMDGLELLKKIKGVDSAAVVIMLTAFDDFSYVREALRLGAFDYILKIASESEIEDAIYRGKECVLKNIQEALDLKTLKQEKQYYQEKAEENLFILLMKNSRLSFDEVRNSLLQRKIFLNWKGYYIVLVDFNYDDNVPMDEQRDRMIENLKEKCITLGLLTYWYFDLDGALIGIIGKSASVADDEELIGMLDCRIKSLGHTGYNISISNEIENIEEISSGYRQALNALNFRIVEPDNHIFYFSKVKHIVPGKALNKHSELVKKTFRDAHAQKRYDLITHSIDQLFRFFETEKMHHPEEIYSCLLDIIMYVRFLITGYDKSREIVDSHNYYLDMNRFPNLLELMLWFKNIILQVFQDDHPKSLTSVSYNLINEAKQYIDKNYGYSLCLSTVANHLGISIGYLSMLFHNEVGVCFKDYITGKRIEKSIYMLMNTERKIKDIALEVGYQDEKHFSQLFKKITGQTPMHVRRSAVI